MAARKHKAKNNSTMASRADRYALYLQSVQEPSVEVAFFDRVFRGEFGRKPMVLREDFCGAAAICYAWVRRRPGRRAIGVDIDPEPLAWGMEHLTASLSEPDLERVTLLERDVRDVAGPKADIVAAQNFSFWVFKTRDALRGYFRAARANLGKQGLFVLDMVGGSESIEEGREDTTKQKGFTYIWEQNRFDPITHDCRFYIHFRFKDGSELRRAFVYDWRMWTIPEIRELLLEAGFSRAQVYWEGTDRKTGEGDGVYRKRDHANSDPAWIAYVIGVKA